MTTDEDPTKLGDSSRRVEAVDDDKGDCGLVDVNEAVVDEGREKKRKKKRGVVVGARFIKGGTDRERDRADQPSC